MPFDSSIPKDMFSGAEIEAITAGGTTISFHLSQERVIHLDDYGTLDNIDDWLYNIKLCGENSAQSLVGQTISVEFLSEIMGRISFSEGRSLDIVSDGVGGESVRFILQGDEYFA